MTAMTAVQADYEIRAFADEASGVVAIPERIFAWAKNAKPGDVFVYATRCHLPPKSAGAAAARTLSDRGLAFLTQKAIPDRAERSYRATRSSVPYAPPRDTHAVDRIIDAEALAIDVLYPILERAARFGRPCPTDSQLSQRTGIPLADIPATIDAMRAQEMILVYPAPAPTQRFVFIVSTGNKTGSVA